ncbi:MAG: hypothetical protein KDK54_22110 [Leptospiraceae bacterium]|nr:hypothetical protein [Leptospiraceae bacterium]
MRFIIILFFLLLQCSKQDYPPRGIYHSGKNAKRYITTFAFVGSSYGDSTEKLKSPFVEIYFLKDIKNSLYYQDKDVRVCALKAMIINLYINDIGSLVCNLNGYNKDSIKSANNYYFEND